MLKAEDIPEAVMTDDELLNGYSLHAAALGLFASLGGAQIIWCLKVIEDAAANGTVVTHSEGES